MSYDLMVFDAAAAPQDRPGFKKWYEKQTDWDEGHSYDDPSVCSDRLRAWFLDMIALFPPMNGPHASEDFDDPKVTDYSVGSRAIYAAFAWSEASSARATTLELAQKHRVGFFDVSSKDGGIWQPTRSGGYARVPW